MSHPKRMWGTLGCLALAMTGTAALLGWIDPTNRFWNNPASAKEVVQLAQSAVWDEVDVDAARWRSVEIVPTVAAGRGGALTAQSAASPEYHFLIDETGRTERCEAWWTQATPLDAPSTVRVRVVQLGGSTLPPLQALAIESVLAAINRVVLPGDQRLPVRVLQGRLMN